MADLEPGYKLVEFEHPNGCHAQQVLNERGELDNSWPRLHLLVPLDRDGWGGVSCGACGRDLRELGGDA